MDMEGALAAAAGWARAVDGEVRAWVAAGNLDGLAVRTRIFGNRLLSFGGRKLTDTLTPAQGVLVALLALSSLFSLGAVAIDLCTFSLAQPVSQRLRRCHEFVGWRLDQLATLVLLLTVLNAGGDGSATLPLDDVALVILFSTLAGCVFNFLFHPKGVVMFRLNQALLALRAALLCFGLLAAFTLPGLAVNWRDVRPHDEL